MLGGTVMQEGEEDGGLELWGQIMYDKEWPPPLEAQRGGRCQAGPG